MLPLELPARPDDRDAWASFLVSRCDDNLDAVRRTADAIAAEPGDAARVLERWNELTVALLNATTAAGLLGQAHPDAAIRDRADAAEQAVAATTNEVRQDRRLYDALSAVDADGLDDDATRMLEMALRDFRRAGVDRDDTTRERLRDLAERDKTLSQTFERNVSDDVREVRLRPEQLDGLPDDYVEAHPVGDDGLVTITTDYPDVFPFRTFATDRDARHALYEQFDNRGWPVNDPILRELTEIRRERARLLGYDGWPDYDAEVRMIGSEAAIRDFVERLDRAAGPASDRDLATLVERQCEDLPDLASMSWADVNYYAQVVCRERLGLDAQEVRRYFAFDKVRAGLLDVTSRLFGLEYTERPDVPTWHEDVTTYDVSAEGALLGRIYLDLHPRDGKFKHAAHFPLVKGVRDVQLPQSALLCNLPRGLMTHGDVVTLFHEFGHLIHAVVGGRQHWARFSGVATERDFIEAPSQMLEEWAWDADVLASFATDDAGTPIPAELVATMRAAQEFGRGFDVRVQIFYAAISVGIHADVPDDLTSYIDDLAKHYMPFERLDGTHKHTSFGHLADEGYGSSYYTYLWSLVIAKDLFSAFDHDDLLAPDVARRYRDTVLAAGGSRDAADLVESFLGRPTNTDAFDRWLTG
ncbi:M3 family metallopeptidase [Nocardioides iriomotensis]|uniref:M3 family metallopeptidase n=1 Tax=Nocardioides iriomotensis TaxID=715784 RepID=UPI00197ECAAB|nr:M3 family metallopeptidase [Nocardioides iriomotensis]